MMNSAISSIIFPVTSLREATRGVRMLDAGQTGHFSGTKQMSLRPKRITRSSMIGEQGIALIHQRVLEMGFLWYPTGSVEAGIDGLIEIRDPATGVVRYQDVNSVKYMRKYWGF